MDKKQLLTANELQLLFFMQRNIQTLYNDILYKKAASYALKDACRRAKRCTELVEEEVKQQLPTSAYDSFTKDMKSERIKDLLLLLDTIKDMDIYSVHKALEEAKDIIAKENITI